MELRPTGITPELLGAYGQLFAKCFPGAANFSADYLRWLYSDNPDGQVVGYDAFEGDALAAHYVCVPAEACVNGRPVRVLLSLNTATAPEFQGRGLFTTLAEATYARAADEGFAGVYGIANANSTPGFLRKLGFTLVSQLDALVGLGAIDESRDVSRPPAASFERAWSPRTLAWRIASPRRPYRLVRGAGGVVGAQAATGKPGLVAWAEVPADSASGMSLGRATPSLRLHLGLRPHGARRGMWFEIPARLRPSPLNLIFRSLVDSRELLDKQNVTLGQLDFDAF